MSDEPNRVHPRRFAPPPPAGDSKVVLFGSSRRIFLDKCFSSLLLLIGISSCKSKEKKADTLTNPCSDYSELSEEDLAKRKSLGYVEKAPTENKQCSNCNLWLPPKNDEPCGRCQLFKGPAPAEAYCTYWAPQV